MTSHSRKKEKSDIISRDEKKDQRKERYGRWRLYRGPKYKYSKGFKHSKFENTKILINLPIERKNPKVQKRDKLKNFKCPEKSNLEAIQ